MREQCHRLALVRLVAAGTLGLFAGCDAGALVTLGEIPQVPHFEPPHLVPNIDSPEKNDNPTLTADLLEIYFTSDRQGGNSDIWMARRASASSPFGPPGRVEAVNDPIAFESSSAISLDGLTLWLGSDRGSTPTDVDIWVSTRSSRSGAWSSPVSLPPLNSPSRDIPRPPGAAGLVMPLASTRDNGEFYRTFFSVRTAVDAPFGAPVLVAELDSFGTANVDGFLTEDGLSLFYSSSVGAGPSDLYLARRRATSAPFTVFQALADLNTPADDRDPWLSPDGTRFFFASDRNGTFQIYQAVVKP